jgi:hypothetical protein
LKPDPLAIDANGDGTIGMDELSSAAQKFNTDYSAFQQKLGMFGIADADFDATGALTTGGIQKLDIINQINWNDQRIGDYKGYGAIWDSKDFCCDNPGNQPPPVASDYNKDGLINVSDFWNLVDTGLSSSKKAEGVLNNLGITFDVKSGTVNGDVQTALKSADQEQINILNEGIQGYNTTRAQIKANLNPLSAVEKDLTNLQQQALNIDSAMKMTDEYKVAELADATLRMQGMVGMVDTQTEWMKVYGEGAASVSGTETKTQKAFEDMTDEEKAQMADEWAENEKARTGTADSWSREEAKRALSGESSIPQDIIDKVNAEAQHKLDTNQYDQEHIQQFKEDRLTSYLYGVFNAYIYPKVNGLSTDPSWRWQLSCTDLPMADRKSVV